MATAPTPPRVHEYTLPSNGLRVVLVSAPSMLRTCVHANYFGVGSGLEDARAERGVAHFTEHMIFKGTRGPDHVPWAPARAVLVAHGVDEAALDAVVPADVSTSVVPREAVERLVVDHVAPDARFNALCACGAGLNLHERDIDTLGRRMGARLNACTSVDTTSYFFDVPAGNVVPFVGILADSAARLHVTDDHVASEIKAVLQEMKRGDDNPGRTAVSAASRLLFAPGEPGHLDTIGQERELMQVRADTLLSFYRRHYHPWRATLTVVGAFDVARVRAAVDACFAPIGTHAYRAHRAVASLVPGAPVPPAVDAHVAALPVGPLRADLATVVDRYRRAHTCGCTVDPVHAVKAVAPLPSRTDHTMYAAAVPPGHPFTVRAWRVPGWAGDDAHADDADAWAAAVEVLTPSTGPAGRLPTSCGAFVDRHRDAGALYVACDAADDVAAVDVDAVRAPLTSAEYARACATLVARHAYACESAGALAEHVVARLGTRPRTSPADAAVGPPRVSKARVDALLALLRPDAGVTVTVRAPTPGTDVHVAVDARDAVRAANARNVALVQCRCPTSTPTPPLHATHFAPTPTPLSLATVPWLTPSAAGTGDTRFVHPSSRIAHYARVPWTAPDRTLAQYATALAAATWTHMVPPDDRRLETRAGVVQVGWSGVDGVTVTGPTSVDEFQRDVQAAEARVARPLDPAVFAVQQRNMATDAARAAHAPMAVAMHAASRACGMVAYGLDDVASYVAALTPTAAAAAARARFDAPTRIMMVAGTAGDVARGPPARASASAPASARASASVVVPTRVLHPPAAPRPVVREVSRGDGATPAAAQAAVVLAKRSVDPVDHALRPFAPILYHIACHSLGSRLFQIREQTGLFYGASGALGAGGDVDHPGLDYVATQVNPGDVARTVDALHGWAETLRRNPNVRPRELQAAVQWYENGVAAALAHPPSAVAKAVRVARWTGTDAWQDEVRARLARVRALTVDETNALFQRAYATPFDAAWVVR